MGPSFFPRNTFLGAGGNGVFNAVFIPSLGKEHVSYLTRLVHFKDFRAELCAAATPGATIFIKNDGFSHVFLL